MLYGINLVTIVVLLAFCNGDASDSKVEEAALVWANLFFVFTQTNIVALYAILRTVVTTL